jgi:PAS domain S-box-containing protein
MPTDPEKRMEELESRLQEARKEAAELRSTLDAVVSGAKKVLKYEGFAETAQALFLLCKKQIGAQSGYVALLSEGGEENEVLFLDSGGLPCTVDPELPMPIRGLRASAYATGEVAWENDFENSDWMRFMPTGHVRLKNVMFAPLVHEGKTVGLFGLANKRGDFDEEDARIALTFGELAAIALREAQRKDEIQQRERKFRSLFDTMSEGVALNEITKDERGAAVDYRIIDINPACEQILGVRREDAVGKTASELCGTGGAAFLETYERVAETGSTESLEVFWPQLQKHFAISAFSPAKGRFATVFNDITEQKNREEQLRVSEKYLSTTLDSIGEAVITADKECRVVMMNPVAEALTGWKTEDAQAQPLNRVFRIFHQHTREEVECPVQKVLREGAMAGLANHTLLVSRDGTEYNIDDSAAPIRGRRGEIVGAILIFRNITEKYQAEARLRESEERFRLAFRTSPDAINLNRLEDGLYIDINEGFTHLMGYSREDAIGRTSLDLNIWKNPEDRRRLIRDLKEWGYVENLDAEFIAKDGRVRNGLMSARVLRLQGEDVIISVARDITERKQAEQTMLRQQEMISLNHRIAHVFLTAGRETVYNEVLDVLLECLSSRYGYFGYIDEEGALVCPTMTREIWDKCQVQGKDFRFPPESFGGLWGRALQEKRTLIANEGLQFPEGHLVLDNAIAVPLVHHGGVIGQFALGNKNGGYSPHDAELVENAAAQIAPILHAHLEELHRQKEQMELEDQLRRAQQIEAIGTLAGGIAHDFNNILSSVIGYTELSLDSLEKDSSLHENLQEVKRAGKRARDLVKQILTLSRAEEEERKPIAVTPLIKEGLKMLRSTVPTSIDFKEWICSDQLIVQADPTQIHQVFMNLALNAVHAMPEGEGTLEVSVSPAVFSPGYAEIPAGQYAEIVVADTGIGIHESQLDRIFTPYYTTKEKGRGTGLGLSVVHGIVKSHKGYITVESTPGKGSVFRVYLPLARSPSPESAQHVEKALQSGTESILLVDDEIPIVKLQQQRLERLGYRTMVKTNSLEALAAFRETPHAFDLVITDMTMPKMTGERLARAIKEYRPDIPVILCTGFSERVEGREGELSTDAVLMKPVNKTQLADTIRKLLDESNPS